MKFPSRILKNRDYEYRKNLLLKLQSAIRSFQPRLLQALHQDLGKTEFEAQLSEVGYVLEDLEKTLVHLQSWMAPQVVPTPLKLKPAKSVLQSEPYGRVLIIAPWNYPFQLLMSPLVGALAAGNQVVLKPSELAPHIEQVMVEMISSTFKADDVQILTGGPEATQKLLQERWDFIFYTGNAMVAKIIARAAAEHLTPMCLELGGKSPCIVEEDAQLDVAVKRITWGKFFNAGQTCVAPDFVMVHESIYEEFLEKLKKTILEFYGEGLENEDFGKIINVRHFERLLKLLEGASVLMGGKSQRETLKLQPTLIQGDLAHASMTDEIFGPILPVFSFKTSSDALEILGRFQKPLALYVFTESERKEKLYTEGLSFGGGCINDCLLHLATMELPFGGVGQSGMGRYHGRYSFETFSHQKGILKRSSWIDVDFRYPPYRDKLKTWIKYFIK